MEKSLRSQAKTHKCKEFKKGDRVLARWKDLKNYPAVVLTATSEKLKVRFLQDQIIYEVKKELVTSLSSNKNINCIGKRKKLLKSLKLSNQSKNGLGKEKGPSKELKSCQFFCNESIISESDSEKTSSAYMHESEGLRTNLIQTEEKDENLPIKYSIRKENIKQSENNSKQIEELNEKKKIDTVNNYTSYSIGSHDDESNSIGLLQTEKNFYPAIVEKINVPDENLSQNFVSKNDMLSSKSVSNSDKEDDSYPESDSENEFNILFAKKENNSSNKIRVVETNNIDKRKWDKKYYCPYCIKSFAKLPRHMKSMHADEEDVSKLMRLSNAEEKKEYDIILQKLRNIGNHKHNCEVLKKGEGDLIVVYRPSNNVNADPENYIPCPMCYGYYGKKELWKHKCAMNGKEKNERALARGRNLLPLPPYIDEHIQDILNSMRQDQITRIIKSDKLICEFVRRAYHSKGGYQYHKRAEIRNNARELARLLAELRNRKGYESYTMTQIIDPCMYRDIIEAVRRLSRFDIDNQKIAVPELARKLGLHLKVCATIMQGTAIENNDKILLEKSENFIKLHNMMFSVEIGAQVQRERNASRRNAPNLLPLSEDVIILTNYLKNLAVKNVDQLRNTKKEEDKIASYAELQKVTLAQIILFNRRREGEVSRMSIKDYINKKGANDNSEMIKSFSKTERNLCKILTRVEIEGKGGRNVPILLTANMIQQLDLLINCRSSVGVLDSNDYLFASCNNQAKYYYRGSACLREFSTNCGAKYPHLLRSTKLRKHVATLSQVLNLKEHELELLARYMGHDIRIHRDYYRIPDAVQQKAVLSKIFLSLEKGELTKNYGKSLEEMEVSFDDENSDESQDEDDDKNGEILESDTWKECEDSESDSDINWPEKKTRRRPWSCKEKEAVERHLLTSILNKRIPGADEIRRCMEKEPVLKNRTWKNVKDYCRNKITSMYK